MKKIVMALAALLVGQTASAALSANSSWEEIFAAKGPYVIHAPVVYMGRAIDYTFVCRDGDSLRTKAPVDVVVNDSTLGDGPTKFKTVETLILSTPINYVHKEDFCDASYNKVVCTPMTYTGTYPMTVNVKVGRKLNKGREVFLFNKSYTVPNCDNASVN
ncbi:hypothetical protein [Bdellovibrio sp. HCB209]|uniref:hypothetical protein n=1 Tax=Bdellovibrio sp. HCB209 TaxID=3394354 RepID=UPI0039B4A54F